MKYNALIVSDKESFAASASELITSSMSCSVTICDSALAARGLARENSYDVIIINSPLSGGLGDDFAKSLTRITYSAVMILSPAEISDRLSARVAGSGIFVINKPLSKKSFLDCFGNACLTGERSKVIFEENEKLRRKMKEIKKVERAKILLIEYLKLTEQQAHRYIEQQAMELRKTKGEIAQSIINTYEA